MTKLVTGPTMPIQNSVLARVGSFSICAMPPRANSVIL
jgi:hypothetical protein